MVLPLVDSPAISATAPAIAAALELAVASVSNPVELNAIGLAVPDWRLTHENTGLGDPEDSTLYRLQPCTDPQNAPYVMDSLTPGLSWVGIAGQYNAQMVYALDGFSTIAGVEALNVRGVSRVGSQPGGTAGIWLDGNAATGNFQMNLSPANLTANRRWTFPDSSGVVAGSAAALTAGRVPYVAAGGALTDSASLLFSGSAFTVGDGTADKSVFAIGGNSGANGGARFQVVNGAGTRIAIGNKSAIVGGGYDATPYLYSNGRLEIGDAIRVASTTAASSSITGAVIVGDGATAATNVGIGGGVIYAGSFISATGTVRVNGASRWFVDMDSTAESGGNAGSNLSLLRYDDAGSFAGQPLLISRANGRATFGNDVYVSGLFQASGGSGSPRFQVSSGAAEVYLTTAASSSLTGSLIVGDTVTAATSVGIGGGHIWCGATGNFFDAAGAQALAIRSNTVQSSWQTVNDSLYHNADYTHAPAAAQAHIFRVSSSYTTICTLKAATASFAQTTSATSSIAGAMVIGDGVTSATNVAIGGGKINTGDQISIQKGTSNTPAEANWFLVSRSGFLGFRHNTSNQFCIDVDNSGSPAQAFMVSQAKSVVVGAVALATTATDGFLYVPTCAGTPTGVPTAQTGTAPLIVNTTNNKLYFYSGGAWRDAGP